jgi:hypothetical protein
MTPSPAIAAVAARLADADADSGGSGSGLLLGEDFFPWMVLAFGAAMVVGNVMAMVRPPAPDGARDLGEPRERPPVGRSVVLIVLGLVAAGWGLASLIA